MLSNEEPLEISSDSDFEADWQNPKKKKRREKPSFQSRAPVSLVKEKIIKVSKDLTVDWFSITIKEYSRILDVIENSQYYNKLKYKGKSIMQSIILDCILNIVRPHAFVPCLFSEYESYGSFYVCNCEAALKKLESVNNICTSELIPEMKFSVHILATSPYQSLSISKLLQQVIRERFNTITNTLNLSNLAADPAFDGKVHFPLWYDGNQRMISMEIEDIMPPSVIEHLDLTYNSICEFKGFDLDVFGSLMSLKVSHNKVEDIAALAPFHGITVKSLDLEFNPICHNYIDGREYIKAVKLIFPTIRTLDGNDVSPNAIPKSHKNFAIDKRCTAMVGKFLEIFYTHFDSDRRKLENIYDPFGLFSVCCQRKDIYFSNRRRNILDKLIKFVSMGPKDIISALSSLPPTEHDPLSFCVDVTYYSDTLITFTVAGLLKIPSGFVTESEPVFRFKRAFILVNVEKKFKIINDIFSVMSIAKAPPDSFRLVSKLGSPFTLTPTSTLKNETKRSLLQLLIAQTHLSEKEAYECLTGSQWNYHTAVKYAIKVMRAARTQEERRRKSLMQPLPPPPPPGVAEPAPTIDPAIDLINNSINNSINIAANTNPTIAYERPSLFGAASGLQNFDTSLSLGPFVPHMVPPVPYPQFLAPLDFQLPLPFPGGFQPYLNNPYAPVPMVPAPNTTINTDNSNKKTNKKNDDRATKGRTIIQLN